MPCSPSQNQHLKRVRTACDCCKRRKAKCTGKQPCAPCALHKLECTFSGSRMRINSTSYVRYLEDKVSELKSQLESFSARSLDQEEQSRPSQIDGDEVLETIVAADGGEAALLEPFTGHHGRFAGVKILHQIQALCSQVCRAQQHPEYIMQDTFIQAFDSATLPQTLQGHHAIYILLPPKEKLLESLGTVVDQALCLMQFIDRASLELGIDRLYDLDEDAYDADDRRTLALVYSLLAIASQIDTTPGTYTRIDHALKGIHYFRASSEVLDIANCHDTTSLQTLLCIIIYLQASSAMSAAYSYVVTAAAAAFRMGLHTVTRSKDASRDECRMNRQVYTVLGILDTHISAVVGLPPALRGLDSPGGLALYNPCETPAQGQIDCQQASPALTETHAKLVKILRKAIDNNYPASAAPIITNGFYAVRYQAIVDIESELDEWLSKLPDICPRHHHAEQDVLRPQLLLRLAHSHVRLILYRPFLHHVVRNSRPGKIFHYKAYACGSACIRAAMEIVLLSEALDDNLFLHGTTWLTVVRLAFAAMCLAVFVTGNEVGPTVEETATSARKAVKLLGKLGEQHHAARYCHDILKA